MTRARQPAERDDHQQFTAWLTNGAGDEPARDLALHGAYCPECRASMAALDLLSLIDTGRASPPPSRPSQVRRRVPALGLPLVGAAMAGLLVAAIAGWALRATPVPFSAGSPSPAQQVLGGGGSASAPPDASQASEASADATRTRRPTASPAPIQPEPSANLPSPEPTEAETPRPSRSTRPTASPTPSPSEIPEPTRVAAPEICDDGLDNDGDGLIDILDPDCLQDGD